MGHYGFLVDERMIKERAVAPVLRLHWATDDIVGNLLVAYGALHPHWGLDMSSVATLAGMHEVLVGPMMFMADFGHIDRACVKELISIKEMCEIADDDCICVAYREKGCMWAYKRMTYEEVLEKYYAEEDIECT